jgi:hypothetical protein
MGFPEEGREVVEAIVGQKGYQRPRAKKVPTEVYDLCELNCRIAHNRIAAPDGIAKHGTKRTGIIGARPTAD